MFMLCLLGPSSEDWLGMSCCEGPCGAVMEALLRAGIPLTVTGTTKDYQGDLGKSLVPFKGLL